jgi:hypothetical protein
MTIIVPTSISTRLEATSKALLFQQPGPVPIWEEMADPISKNRQGVLTGLLARS